MKRRLIVLPFFFVLALLLGLAVGVRYVFVSPASVAPATRAPANTPVAPGFVFEGMVHYVGGNVPAQWVIDDYPVTVTADTVIVDNGLPARPGVWARVEAIKAVGLQATTLELQAVPAVEIYDRIQAVDATASQWQVGGTWVRLGPTTVVSGLTPQIGYLALVRGVRSEDGIAADHIVVVATDAEAVMQGSVVRMEASTWQVDDVVVDIVPTTVFSGALPSLGSQVQVRGAEIAPRRIQASHIWTLNAAATPIQFTGWLQRIDGQDFPYLWRVNLLDGPQLRQVYVVVDTDAMVDETVGPAAPGAWLSGEVVNQGDSVYRAVRIAILPRAPKRQIVGQIAALPAAGLTGIWQVGAYRVEVGQDTGIVGTPQVGAMVWLSGAPDYANVIQAQLIEVLGE